MTLSPCAVLVAVLVIGGGAASLAHAAPLAAGESCVLKKPTRLSATAKLKGAKTPARKGETVEVIGIEGKIAHVRVGQIQGYLNLKDLNRICKAPPPSATPVTPAAAAPLAPPPSAPAETPPAPAPVAPPAPETSPASSGPATPPAIPTPAPGPGALPASPPSSAPPDVGAHLPVPKAEPQAATTGLADHLQAPADAPDPSSKTRVAVMAVRGAAGMAPELIDTLTNVIPQTLEELGPFKAITSNDIQQMLAMESLKQSLGCNDVSCLAEIGGAIGADYLITGSIIDVGGAFLLQLQLMNIRDARVASRISRDYAGGAKGLLDEVRTATKILVRDILAAKSGTLALTVSEEGATVKIDGSIVGVSPMEPFSVAGGVHTLAIEKEGFVVFNRDVEISQRRESRVEATLLPSEEFKRAYVANAETVRLVAWVGLAAGVAAIGGAVATFLVSKGEADGLRDEINRFNDPAYVKTPEEERRLTDQRTNVATLDGLALGLGAGGIVVALVGVILFAAGDDPGKFEAVTRTETVSQAPTLRLVPSLTGFGVAGTF